MESDDRVRWWEHACLAASEGRSLMLCFQLTRQDSGPSVAHRKAKRFYTYTDPCVSCEELQVYILNGSLFFNITIFLLFLFRAGILPFNSKKVYIKSSDSFILQLCSVYTKGE